jgi:hypothetical protein
VGKPIEIGEGEMKRVGFLTIGILVLSSILHSATARAGGLPDVWTEIDPADYGFKWEGLTPACTGAPGTSSDKFTFFVKGGKRDKLVIYFQGGGACWDPLTCGAYASLGLAATCTLQQRETVSTFTEQNEGKGIFDTTQADNPFKDWGFVYIPYCTGDLLWGAQDTQYQGDPLGWLAAQGMPSAPFVIKHRGFVNFQAVLKYLKENVHLPKKIFVTGSSAGSYGATLSFPYIQEAYPFSQMYLLGDAGSGVTGGNFNTEGIVNWNAQMPDWIFPEANDPNLTMDEMYTRIAAEYPWSKLAQYTTAYDGTQILFFNVEKNINNPSAWRNVTQQVSDEWHQTMTTYAGNVAAESPNYRYYIAAGTSHTIMMTSKFYTEQSAGGVPFVTWVTSMVENPFGTHCDGLEGNWKNLECETCLP